MGGLQKAYAQQKDKTGGQRWWRSMAVLSSASSHVYQAHCCISSHSGRVARSFVQCSARMPDCVVMVLRPDQTILVLGVACATASQPLSPTRADHRMHPRSPISCCAARPTRRPLRYHVQAPCWPRDPVGEGKGCCRCCRLCRCHPVGRRLRHHVGRLRPFGRRQ